MVANNCIIIPPEYRETIIALFRKFMAEPIDIIKAELEKVPFLPIQMEQPPKRDNAGSTYADILSDGSVKIRPRIFIGKRSEIPSLTPADTVYWEDK